MRKIVDRQQVVHAFIVKNLSRVNLEATMRRVHHFAILRIFGARIVVGLESITIVLILLYSYLLHIIKYNN